MNKHGFTYPVIIISSLLILAVVTFALLTKTNTTQYVSVPSAPVIVENPPVLDSVSYDDMDAPAYEPLFTEYRSDKFGFKIKYPDGYSVSDDAVTLQDMLASIRFAADPLGESDPVFSVDVYDILGGPISVDTLAGVYENPTITDETIGGIAVKKIVGRSQTLRDNELRNTYEIIIYVLSDERLYLVRSYIPEASEEVSSLNMAAFVTFYSSFELL